jgi:hypothetical protein
MKFAPRYGLGCAAVYWSVVSAGRAANYSVQLLDRLAPKDWTDEQWASVVDTMIGKTSGVVS